MSMLYDYENTSIALYRALFKENYIVDVACYLKPDIALANAAEMAPILHPTFTSASRAPDIVANRATGMYDPDTGGTSVFDRPGALSRSDGDLFIPEGTEIPPDLKVRKDKFNDRLKATHFTIMPSKPMFKDALLGQLDNFVRSAIRKQYEAAHK